jgi:hypothetical protein
MITRYARRVLAVGALLLLVGGGVALAAHGHHSRHRALAHHASGAELVQQCIAAKAAGTHSAACEAANDAANPPLTAAQLARLQVLARECAAEKAVPSSDRSACAEADALVGG